MKAKISIVVLSLLLSFIALHAHAANLNVSPTSGTYALGKTFSVTVSVSSPTQSINAVSGTINFPSDKLEVVGIGKSNSIVSFWSPGFPSFSNSAGTVSFEGVVFNPGYMGSFGNILSITFRTKSAEGVAPVTFARGSVLANDGQGSEVVGSLGSATFSLIPAAVSQPVESKPVVQQEVQVPIPEEIVPVPVVQSVVAAPAVVTSHYSTTELVIFFSSIIFLLLLLILYFGRKYHVLRRTIGEAFLEEEQQKNKVLKFLKSDVIKRMAIIKKLKYDKKLTPEEQDIILDIEKRYEIK